MTTTRPLRQDAARNRERLVLAAALTLDQLRSATPGQSRRCAPVAAAGRGEPVADRRPFAL